MSETTTQGQKQAKRYNVIGVIAGLVTRSMTNGTFTTFKLVRGEGQEALNCVAFDKGQEKILAFANGASVKIFGHYEDRAWKDDAGKDVKQKRFRVLFADAPRAKDAAAPAAAAETAETDQFADANLAA